MNLYGLTNGDDKRMARVGMGSGFGGYHSAGIVIAAHYVDDARQIARAEFIQEMIERDKEYKWSHDLKTYQEDLAEGRDQFLWLKDIRKISLVKPGVIYYGEGEC